MTSVQTHDRCHSRFFSARTLHLFTLCGFAVSQPILTALEQQAVYIRDQQVDWLEIGVFLTLLLLVLPVGFFIADKIVLSTSRITRGFGRNAILLFLFTILILSLLRPVIGTRWMTKQGIAGLTAFSIAFSCSCLLVCLYECFGWFRTWLSIASIGLLVFPVSFLWQFHAIQSAETELQHRIKATNPIPVVFVVFDEFNATTLMNERMEIDSSQFPGFARLAENSTWYRNMTTVHPRTGTAVPAILSGRFPVSEKPPVGTEFPGNLLQVIVETKQFDMVVFEPATRICPRSLCIIPEPPRPLANRCVDLIYTLATVYPRLIFTQDSPIYFPVIPKPWFGIHVNSISASPRFRELTQGLFAYNRGLNRNQQLEHFLDCIIPSDDPRFCFIHAMIPHYPWCFLPNGDKYQAETFNTHAPPVGGGELGEDWPAEPNVALRYEHRYRLQVGYVDQFIQKLLDRLEASNSMDSCLLIVTADHGVAFRPGHSRRVPDADNIAEVMSVPLFIKMPGQTEGRIDERNVETVDLLPTVAEVLGIELPEPVDGISISQETRRPRKTIYLDKSMSVIEPEFPQRMATVQRQSKVFGAEPLERLPIQAISRPEWNGRLVTDFKVADDSAEYQLENPLILISNMESSKSSTLAHRLICGYLIPSGSLTKSDEILLAVNGVVQDSYRSGANSTYTHYFEFLLPPTQSTQGPERTDLYLVEQSNDGVTLRPLKPAQSP